MLVSIVALFMLYLKKTVGENWLEGNEWCVGSTFSQKIKDQFQNLYTTPPFLSILKVGQTDFPQVILKNYAIVCRSIMKIGRLTFKPIPSGIR
jgi:hypothetical protein